MKLLVSALEPSSNEHLKALLKLLPKKIQLMGIFDASLGDPSFLPEDFSVMGFWDVFKKLPFFLRVQRHMLKLAKDADKILFLDSSSFHIPLGKKLKKLYPQKELIYYILPQVWAWKPWRAGVIESTFDRLGAILPFELDYYKSKAQYVGHPLLDSIKNFRDCLHGEGIVFMPGSRKGEIGRIFPIFCELANRFFSDKRKILVVPMAFWHLDLQKIYGEGVEDFEISFDAHQSLYGAEFAFICSGTATLEAALIGVPFVLAYKARWLDYIIARSLVNLHYIGLANIFFNALNGQPPGRGESRLHPEIIQGDMSSESLFEAYRIMDREEFFQNAKKIRQYLKHGSASTIASWLE
ncbi:lipid-A-disaccharide synthase [Helicobacter mustelae]|uniref:Lipid-A-disaccharide synthase n=1 Tax=Helicobacter mustelae (strain ATCC 43772 / CCUG 25715 / CIP 103759 / LMG 18044 / NCTC 12198 / R85-136P) TaxID=679897 RepID=D3UI39_HELM1|nr:lipid-A-disaccharide synthase [Helicobacter mustelae]CBG40162.1 lipid-A-disaccharide synthase [Helicobacter mustelae 12198]SQH71664.1 lipid-A-disaccharide synthase [Helicobacter mustelae]